VIGKIMFLDIVASILLIISAVFVMLWAHCKTKMRQYKARLDELQELLLSDPNEDTKLLNWVDNHLNTCDYGLGAGNGAKYTHKGKQFVTKNYRDSIRVRMMLDKQLENISTTVKLLN